MDVHVSLKKCGTCCREILIEEVLIGVSHTTGLCVTCWECFPEEKKKEIKEKYLGG